MQINFYFIFDMYILFNEKKIKVKIKKHKHTHKDKFRNKLASHDDDGWNC